MKSPKKRNLLASLGAIGAAIILAATLAPASCGEADRMTYSRAQRITSTAQLIGGPSARGEIGDYLIENDHVRVIVQDLNYNRGSGIFGGSLIDADLVRLGQEGDLLSGNGRDSFGEMFPAFFLEVIDPEEIEIVNDGKDGEAAVIEVRGRGGEFVTMLRLFNQVMVNSYNAQPNIQRALQNKPPRLDQEPQVELSVRYILEPDARHVRVESRIRNISFKKLEFPNKSIVNLLSTALGIDLGNFTVPAGQVLGFGKLNSPFLPGIGYDLQFGLQDVYANPIDLPALPGHRTPIVASSSKDGISYGYAIDISADGETIEERAAREHFVYAKDQEMNASGEPFYGGGAAVDEMLFLFYASGFGGVFTHQLPGALSPSFCEGDQDAQTTCEALYAGAACEGEECQGKLDSCLNSFDSCREQITGGTPSEFVFTSYLVIGDGDVSSIWDEIYKIRGTTTQEVLGRVLDGMSGQPAGAGETVLLYKARADVTAANQQCTEDEQGKPYIHSQVFSQEAGYFTLDLPPGIYCYRTRSGGSVLGDYVRFEVKAGENLMIEPVVNPPGRISVKVLDEAGQPLPAKITVVGTHPYQESPKGPRGFLFDLASGEHWRITDMIPDDPADPATRRYIEDVVYVDASGSTTFEVRPNFLDREVEEERFYDVYISRGPEYEVVVQRVQIAPGETVRVAGRLVRSVDTTDYLSADLHLHARGSIDSGLDYNRRLISLAGEGLEIAVATDHNYVSDFKPYVIANELTPWMNSVIGLELTTFEAGHFNAFPIEYDVESANRGSFQWQNQAPGLIFEELRQRSPLSPSDSIIQANHPRDSILGYFSQHNVNALNTDVVLPFQAEDAGLTDAVAAANGPAFYTELEDGTFESTFSWNFDAIEVFNGKRFELLRHFRARKEILLPVYTEYYTTEKLDERGLDVDDCVAAREKLDTDCAADPMANGCDDARGDADECTVAETEAELDAEKHLEALGEEAVIVCEGGDVAFPGHLDDWYNMLNNDRPFGVREYERQAVGDADRLAEYEKLYKRYTATGNSDSHRAEFDDPGYPRNYVYVGHDIPFNMTDKELVDGVKNHQVVVTNGPFALLTIDDTPIGGEVSTSTGKVSVTMEVRAPSWMDVTRYRLVGNGEVVASGEVTLSDTTWKETIEVNVPRDTWFVLEVEGDASMFPVLAPNEIPPFDLETAIGSLAGPFGFGGGAEGLKPELTFPVTPFAFTNPIWVVADGDGTFSPPNTPQAQCIDTVLELDGDAASALVAPGPARKLGSRRNDAIEVPFSVTHPKPVTSRIKGEMRDVRVIFEAWGHSH